VAIGLFIEIVGLPSLAMDVFQLDFVFHGLRLGPILFVDLSPGSAGRAIGTAAVDRACRLDFGRQFLATESLVVCNADRHRRNVGNVAANARLDRRAQSPQKLGTSICFPGSSAPIRRRHLTVGPAGTITRGQQQFMEQVRKFEASRPAGEATAAAYFRPDILFKKAKTDSKRQADFEQLIELTKQPECYFSEQALRSNSFYSNEISSLIHLLLYDAIRLKKAKDLEAAMDRYLAMVRLIDHRLQGQNSLRVTAELNRLPFDLDPDRELVKWAQHPNQTSDLLRKAIAELQRYPAARIVEPILADREKIRAVLTGKDPPSFLNEDHPRWSGYLAYLANRTSVLGKF